jgi:hypothetical protein
VQPVVVPFECLYSVTVPVAEHKERAAEQVKLKALLDNDHNVRFALSFEYGSAD